MLKSFSVENFKGFKDKIFFQLDKPKDYIFNQEIIVNNCISKGIIYGINGSGKSNLGFAIFDIVLHLTDKERNYNQYNNYLNLESGKPFAEFEYTFLFEGIEVIYRYRKQTSEKLIEEHLFIGGKEVIYYDFNKNEGFSRLAGTEVLNNTFNKKSSISRVKYISSNSILEDTIENKVFLEFMDFVNRMLFFYSTDSRCFQGFTNGSENVDEGILEKGKLKEFQQFLFENGVSYDLIEQTVNGKNRIFCHFPNQDVGIFEIASTGTKTMALFFYWYIRMQEASFVYIDEFDAFYHFELAASVVKKLCEIQNAQIIITTHNTDLMSNDLLRPDCYFIIHNNKIKSVADSTNKELRQAHNLQKMYKAGAFDNEKE